MKMLHYSSTLKKTTNMKKIVKYAAVAALAMVSFVSCDLLDNKPYDTYTKDNYFSSKSNLDLFVNYFYSEFTGYGNGGGYGDFYFNTLNDDQAKTGMTPWVFEQVPASAGAWKTPYNQLRRCNLLIENAPTVPGLSEAEINNYVGIGRLFRAWQHYNLVRNFGDCYLIDHVVDPGETDIVYGKRTDRDVVMDFVLEDLKFACANINQMQNSRVEINKYVAAAMMAEITLYEASFCKYRSAADGQKAADPARAEKFYRECCTACEEIINSGKFSLTPKYADVYKSLNLAGNPEMILYKHYAYPSLAHSVIDYTCGSTQVSGMSKSCFNSYLSKDGELMTYGDDHGELIDGKPSMANQIAARDPRLAVHVDNLLQYKGNGVIRYEGNDAAAKNAAASTSSTGYGVAKFDTDQLDREHRQEVGKGDTDAPIFWYAVILLNYAEAKAELGEFAQVQTITLDALRARAGNVWGFDYSFHDPMNDAGVSDLIWEIRRERRVELMYDNNDRYWCLIRWHQLHKLDTQDYPDQAKGAWIAGFVDDLSKCDGATYPFVDADGYIDCHNGGADRKYDPKYYLLPIPSGQRLLNPEIGQNYGWE